MIKFLNNANEANPNFGFKYNILSPADLVPKIPNTDISLFLEWRKYNPQPLILYYNYFPKAGQTPICMNEEQHNLVILQILLTNPNFTILLPKCPEALKGIPRIVGCDLAFNCIETPSCENLYKINKIQIHCDYSVHFDIGGTELYMNTDFFTRKNHILHFNKYGVIHIIRQIDSYYSFPITINLQNTLNRIGCDLIYLKQSDRPKLNQTLKINNIDDSIQIEHFNGGVERLIQILLLQINNTSSNLETRIKSCMEIHNRHTACCYKLVKGDKDLNANTKESDYISKIYIPNNIGHSN
jgi:hypothetical protein